MKQTAAFLIILTLVACGLHADPGDAQQKQAKDGRNVWREMEEQDAKLRAQFKKIKPGMTDSEVRELVKPAGPQILRENLWGLRLSIASNTWTEKDVTLLVAFKDGKVSKTDVTYTCVYVEWRE